MATTTTSTRARLHYGWIVLGVGTLVVCGALGLARFGYSIVLPAMQASLGLTNTQAGGLATANLIGYLALTVIGGVLAARFGPRRVIAVGLALAGAGMLLTGLSDGFLAAAAWRALTGIGSGASNVPMMGLLSAWFVAQRRGLATGIAVGGSSIALIAVGPLVPRILSIYGENGWRLSWFLFGGATIGVALGGFFLLRNRPAEIGLRPLGEAEGSVSEPNTSRSPSSTGGLRWGLVYRKPAVWHLGLVYVAFGFSYIIYMTFFTKRLIAEGGYTPASAGSLFTLIGWLSLLSGVIWGAWSDRAGRKVALACAYLVQGAAYVLFAAWPDTAGFTLSAILFGLTAWGLPAIMAAVCGDTLGPRLAPAALGFITLFMGIGQAIGPSVAGALADAAGTFAPAFWLAGFMAALGAVGALWLRPASTTPATAAP